MKKIELLDCTLRDGSYITESHFGAPAMKGIIKKMQEAKADIIECGWLKDKEYEKDTTFYHLPSDLEPYILDRKPDVTYVVMIDYNRYDDSVLPPCDGKSIDAVRVVFPHSKQKEGIEIGNRIKDKGYKVFYQAANTMSYSDEELIKLAEDINETGSVALSIVDTFGAMFYDDLERITGLLDRHLDKGIKLGFHSHNNRQLSFALTIRFCELLSDSERNIIVDSSLYGMGRGAGNANTELVAAYLNRRRHGDYDLNAIYDAIDMYILPFSEKYKWGYSTEYSIAGLYQCHVNNIAYLEKNHRASAKEMSNVIASLSEEERRHYDYDLLESKYIENQNREVDDENVVNALTDTFKGKKILLVAPGRSVIEEKDKVQKFIKENVPLVIGVNAFIKNYTYDYVFITSKIRYDYAKLSYGDVFEKTKKILLSNVKIEGNDELIINYNRAIKRGWLHFDNAVICMLRLLDSLDAKDVYIAGFDGFSHTYNESYADPSLPTINPTIDWDDLNLEIEDIFKDLCLSVKDRMKIAFVTDSIFKA